MVSKLSPILMFLLILCGLAFSVDSRGLVDSKQNNEILPISSSDLLKYFHSEDRLPGNVNLLFMLWVASYGDHLYDLPKDLSAECWRTARANSLMLEKLVICQESYRVMVRAVDRARQDLEDRTELTEHPLEPVCRQIEEGYANSNLSSLFEKARKDAANFEKVTHRPPYFQKLIGEEELILKMVEKSDVAELAKALAISIFRNVLRGCDSVSNRTTFFARSCRAVAKKERFAESMQRIFEKTINDVLPEIMVNDRVQKYTSSEEYDSIGSLPLWWVPNMMKMFYGYIAKDPILKKEIDDMAVIMNQDASEEDLDFSKF